MSGDSGVFVNFKGMQKERKKRRWSTCEYMQTRGVEKGKQKRMTPTPLTSFTAIGRGRCVCVCVERLLAGHFCAHWKKVSVGRMRD